MKNGTKLRQWKYNSMFIHVKHVCHMQYHVITRGLSKNNIFVDVNHTFSWNHIIKIIAEGVNFFARTEIFHVFV